MENNKFECDACHRIFKSSRSLSSHYRFCKVGTHISKRLKYQQLRENGYKCECGREFNNAQSLNAHYSWCLKHKELTNQEVKLTSTRSQPGNKCNLSKEYMIVRNKIDQFYAMHKKSAKVLREKYKNGEIISHCKGKHLSDEIKQKLRDCAAKYRKTHFAAPCRYNKSSILILEQIAKEHGWNIQHAENGGEFYTGIGYWLDAYDKEKNIVLEYDEPEHYDDVENNILREKDLKRQKEIIEHLHCEYWRYNEKTKCLWKVE